MIMRSLTEKETAFDVYPFLADFNPIKQVFAIVALHVLGKMPISGMEYFAFTTT